VSLRANEEMLAPIAFFGAHHFEPSGALPNVVNPLLPPGGKVIECFRRIVREACHEVQRPVFYAIAIIITAYLPIFTLQRVEGRLFRPSGRARAGEDHCS